jgi:nuclear transcription Y subunit beta
VHVLTIILAADIIINLPYFTAMSASADDYNSNNNPLGDSEFPHRPKKKFLNNRRMETSSSSSSSTSSSSSMSSQPKMSQVAPVPVPSGSHKSSQPMYQTQHQAIPKPLPATAQATLSPASTNGLGPKPVAPGNAANAADPKFEDDHLDNKQAENYFPAANVARLVKKVVPGNAKISKEAVAEIQEKVSDFISFISSEAGVHCISSNRRTVKGDDIISALSDLGYDNYAEVLSIYLSKFKESMEDTKPAKKVKTGPEPSAPSSAKPGAPPVIPKLPLPGGASSSSAAASHSNVSKSS